MARLKAYAWEKEKWPTEAKINIQQEYRERLTLKLCKYFEISNVHVALVTRGGGTANYTSRRIRLPNWSHQCPLSLILHEISHLLDYMRNQHRGHTGTFRTTLIKVYVEYKAVIKKIFEEIRAEDNQQREEREKEVLRAERKEESVLKQQKFRKSDEFKIKILQTRIKKLTSRKKRIETIMKKATRQLTRLQKKAVTSSMEVIINHD